MTNEDSEFKAFNNFGVDEVAPQASISGRMLRRLEQIDNATTPSLGIQLGLRREHFAFRSLTSQTIRAVPHATYWRFDRCVRQQRQWKFARCRRHYHRLVESGR